MVPLQFETRSSDTSAVPIVIRDIPSTNWQHKSFYICVYISSVVTYISPKKDGEEEFFLTSVLPNVLNRTE